MRVDWNTKYTYPEFLHYLKRLVNVVSPASETNQLVHTIEKVYENEGIYVVRVDASFRDNLIVKTGEAGEIYIGLCEQESKSGNLLKIFWIEPVTYLWYADQNVTELVVKMLDKFDMKLIDRLAADLEVGINVSAPLPGYYGVDEKAIVNSLALEAPTYKNELGKDSEKDNECGLIWQQIFHDRNTWNKWPLIWMQRVGIKLFPMTIKVSVKDFINYLVQYGGYVQTMANGDHYIYENVAYWSRGTSEEKTDRQFYIDFIGWSGWQDGSTTILNFGPNFMAFKNLKEYDESKIITAHTNILVSDINLTNIIDDFKRVESPSWVTGDKFVSEDNSNIEKELSRDEAVNTTQKKYSLADIKKILRPRQKEWAKIIDQYLNYPEKDATQIAHDLTIDDINYVYNVKCKVRKYYPELGLKSDTKREIRVKSR